MKADRALAAAFHAFAGPRGRDIVERTSITLLGPFLRSGDIESIPPWMGRLSGIAVPSHARRAPAPAPTTRGGANINILLELLEQTRDVAGDVAECGVFRGRTLVPLGLYLAQRRLDRDLLGFDSFAGFSDAAVEHEEALGGVTNPDKRKGGFSNTSYGHVLHKVRAAQLSRVILVPGYFEDTLSTYAERRFSFVHLDCDVYDAYRTCLDFFYPRLSRGGVVLLDEYNDPPWPGCNKAVDEFLADKPEKPAEVSRDNFRKWYFRRM